MGIEIERKFLVTESTANWLMVFAEKSEIIKQGYITNMLNDSQVRVRTVFNELNQHIACMTIKSSNCSMVRKEYEVDINYDTALDMIYNLCGNRIIEKQRYHIPQNTKTIPLDITLDAFTGEHTGLFMVEVEVDNEQQSKFEVPSWVIKEVTDDPAYYNANLAL